MDFLTYVKSIPNNRSDKYDLGYVTEFYNDLLTPRKFSCNKLLEIGIHYGQSILMWKDYFVNAEIHGLDINYCAAVANQKRIYSHYLNAYTDSTLELFEPNSFDIVIDDGPHTLESMVFFCNNYFKLVKEGGVLILEDIINTQWTPILANLFSPNNVTVVNMAGKALTEDLKNKWKHGLDVIIAEKNNVFLFTK